LQAIFDEFSRGTDIDPALRYYFINRTCWGGMPSRIHNVPSFQYAKGWRIVLGERLWQAAGLLQGVTISAGDYLPLLRAPGEGVWIYCDPCYYINNEVPKSSWLYRYNFTAEQHVAFARHVTECPHKVVISHADHPFIRSLYSDPRFRIFVTNPMRYQLNGKNARELIITNY
jgi:site-specific DNA-adenine methylase